MICKDVCMAMPFFSKLLPRLKAVNAFCRVNSYRRILRAKMEENGWDSRILRNRPPALAVWRWDTLYALLNYWVPVVSCLYDVWTLHLFKNARKAKQARAAQIAISAREFQQEVYTAHDVCAVVHTIRTWGSGCSCCEADLIAGKSKPCPRKGKRMRELRGKLATFKEKCYTMSDGPMPGDTCYGVDLSVGLQVACSYVFQRIHVQQDSHFSYVDAQPYPIGWVTIADELAMEGRKWADLPIEDRGGAGDSLFDPEGDLFNRAASTPA